MRSQVFWPSYLLLTLGDYKEFQIVVAYTYLYFMGYLKYLTLISVFKYFYLLGLHLSNLS